MPIGVTDECVPAVGDGRSAESAASASDVTSAGAAHASARKGRARSEANRMTTSRYHGDFRPLVAEGSHRPIQSLGEVSGRAIRRRAMRERTLAPFALAL